MFNNELLRSGRIKNNMRREDVSYYFKERKLSISVNTIGNHERGSRSPRPEFFPIYAELYDIPLKELMTGGDK